MVRKLFKHEILSYLRIMLPVYAIVLTIAFLGRVLQIFESDSTVYNLTFSSSVLIYIFAIIVSFVITTIFAVVRFYKNLFSNEGYLSFTLPITSTQHILVKLLTALLFEIATFFTTVISVLIITSGDLLNEIFKVIEYIFSQFVALHHNIHIILFATEIVLIMISYVAFELLLYYTCITLGQTFRKNRVLAAVGIYFGYYVISQIMGTVFIIVVSIASSYIEFEAIGEYITAHPIAFSHMLFCGILLFSLILSTALFLISNSVIKRRLNLQ